MLKIRDSIEGLVKIPTICSFVVFTGLANAASIDIGKTITNQTTKGLAIVYPDVCLTPPQPGAGPIPIPYPNMPTVPAYKAILTPAVGLKEQWIPVSLGRKQTVSFRGASYNATRTIVLEDKNRKKPVSGFQSSHTINAKCKSGYKCISLTVDMTPPAGLPVGKYGLKLMGDNNRLLAEFIFNVSSSSKTTGTKQVKEKPASSVSPKKQIQQQIIPDIIQPK